MARGFLHDRSEADRGGCVALRAVQCAAKEKLDRAALHAAEKEAGSCGSTCGGGRTWLLFA